MDFRFRPSEKSVVYFKHKFFAENAQNSLEKSSFNYRIFFESLDFVFNHVFLLLNTLGGSEKPHNMGLKLIPKNPRSLQKCQFFVTKTLKCNISVCFQSERYSICFALRIQNFLTNRRHSGILFPRTWLQQL